MQIVGCWLCNATIWWFRRHTDGLLQGGRCAKSGSSVHASLLLGMGSSPPSSSWAPAPSNVVSSVDSGSSRYLAAAAMGNPVSDPTMLSCLDAASEKSLSSVAIFASRSAPSGSYKVSQTNQGVWRVEGVGFRTLSANPRPARLRMGGRWYVIGHAARNGQRIGTADGAMFSLASRQLGMAGFWRTSRLAPMNGSQRIVAVPSSQDFQCLGVIDPALDL